MRHRLALLSLGILISALFATAARAEYYQYEQWEKLSPPMRTSYVAGAFDAFVYFLIGPSMSPEISLATTHFSRCIVEKKMPAAKLAENIRTFASDRPMLRAGYVQDAMVQYLSQACGAP